MSMLPSDPDKPGGLRTLNRESWALAYREVKEASWDDTGYIPSVLGAIITLLVGAVVGVYFGNTFAGVPGGIAGAIVGSIVGLFVFLGCVLLAKRLSAPRRILEQRVASSAAEAKELAETLQREKTLAEARTKTQRISMFVEWALRMPVEAETQRLHVARVSYHEGHAFISAVGFGMFTAEDFPDFSLGRVALCKIVNDSDRPMMQVHMAIPVQYSQVTFWNEKGEWAMGTDPAQFNKFGLDIPRLDPGIQNAFVLYVINCGAMGATILGPHECEATIDGANARVPVSYSARSFEGLLPDWDKLREIHPPSQL